jgi:hypothetical protein
VIATGWRGGGEIHSTVRAFSRSLATVTVLFHNKLLLASIITYQVCVYFQVFTILKRLSSVASEVLYPLRRFCGHCLLVTIRLSSLSRVLKCCIRSACLLSLPQVMIRLSSVAFDPVRTTLLRNITITTATAPTYPSRRLKCDGGPRLSGPRSAVQAHHQQDQRCQVVG